MTDMSHCTTKPTKQSVRLAKIQISLVIHPVWSESSLCTLWVAKDPLFLHADSEDSDQTLRMPRLIWVFAGHTGHFVGFVLQWLICFSRNYAALMTIPGVCLRKEKNLSDPTAQTARSTDLNIPQTSTPTQWHWTLHSRCLVSAVSVLDRCQVHILTSQDTGPVGER